ncbi:glycosyltransferase family 2 protein [Amycolatopsis carbonis]|uniref:Glycosyltransferase family 2 protein n=1 Tax=Amycolatopsis carbonis TaxID=715471 RepID=A0A9Y2MXS4_9PSEU|nr:glycosyltransferase family 2 protein [Amycolatopsis sp. 2-15]WIX79344.1 glycosyltransferase family 2 protein [Amycolatopsis sp. 2-15]
MIPLWLLAIFVFGVNFTLWGTAGLARALENRVRPPRPPRPSPVPRARPAHVHRSRVAVLMAAHNEEVVIGESLAAITRLVPASNVHVVSDGSTDRTVELALACGVNVTETPSNVGKAGALEEGVRHFSLATRFDAVLLLDADTRLDPDYFDAALPQFDDPDVVAVAGCAATDWSASRRGFLPFLFTAHRARIYALLQRLLKFGQTWHRTNATLIVPGFASLYRAEALPHIDINPPGLVIEDFNMTFEVYRKRLGKVGFSLKAIAVTQDPDAFRDYVRQTRRWALGFWQSVRRYRPRADLFSFMLGLYVLELVFASLFMALLPVMVVLLLLALIPGFLSVPVAGDVTLAIGHYVNLPTIAFGILVPDLLLTLAVVLTERRARYLLMAPLYLPLRCLDACVALWSLPQAWRDGSGRWQSPARRTTDIAATPDLATIGAGAGAGAGVGAGLGSGLAAAASAGSPADTGLAAGTALAADTGLAAGTSGTASTGLAAGTAGTGFAAGTSLGSSGSARSLPSPFPRDLLTQHNGSGPAHSNGSSRTVPSLPPTTSNPSPTSDTEPDWPPEWPPDPFSREKVG